MAMKTILSRYMYMWQILAYLVINVSLTKVRQSILSIYNANSLKLNLLILLQKFSKTFFQQLLILFLIYKTFVTRDRIMYVH